MEALFGHPILQSLLAGILSWISVSLGASAIFLRREFSRLAMDCMLGAAGGMMLGAAFLGLLQPAAEMASHMGRLHFIPIVCGLMAGAAFLMGLDHLLPHLHIRQKQQEGLSTSWRRSVLLVTAMALHHIPEGLTMGVGYGAVAAGSTLPSGVALEMSSAFMVTGTTLLQNLPEGLVVATALRAEGFSAKRSWLCGVFSGCTALPSAPSSAPSPPRWRAVCCPLPWLRRQAPWSMWSSKKSSPKPMPPATATPPRWPASAVSAWS